MRIPALALFFAAFICEFASGQQTVAPTNAPLGSARGEDVAGYNVTNSFETGYRFSSVGGNLGKYRSDVNFGNGIRLLSGNLTVNSKDGHGKYFDELLLSTQGLGNDPYEYSTLRISKNRLYRYDLTWRLNEYYNPGLTISSGQHFQNTVRTMSDHNLVLLPDSPFRLFVGYSRVNQNGPALSTINLFDSRGDEFPLFTDIRRIQNEYRLGFELSAFGAKLSVMHGWEYYREDTRNTAPAEPGNNPSDLTSIDSFRRDQPYHGSTGSWRANLRYDNSNFFALNGRFTYAGTRRDFIFDEAVLGASRFGDAQNRQTLVIGNGRRPVTTAGFTGTLYPSQKITIVNHFSYYNTRMDGDGLYSQFDNATLSAQLLNFQFLGIRTFSNETDVNVRLSKAVGFYTGYQYSNRLIRSIEQTTFDTEPDREAFNQRNQLHSGRFGLRLQPLKPLSIVLDAEIGRADRPIYPISDRNYHLIGGRVQYKTRTLLITALARTNYNTNSVSLSTYSSKARTYSLDASWTARPWVSFDASYSKLHLNTLGGIAYFYNNQLTNDQSIYVSNIHSGYFGARFAIGNRAEVTTGYSRIQDTGDGRGAGTALPYILGMPQPTLVPGTLAYQSYPLSFQSPLARFSLLLNKRVRWNAGYQYYGYAEDLIRLQNYRAHTGYTSLSWMF